MQLQLIVQVMDLQKLVQKIRSSGESSWKHIFTNHTSNSTANNMFMYSLHRVILLIDMVAGIQESDSMLMEMLTETKRPFMTVVTKADKVKDSEIEQRLK